MTRFAAKRFVYGHLQLRPFWNRDLFPRLEQTTQQPLFRTICTIGGLVIVWSTFDAAATFDAGASLHAATKSADKRRHQELDPGTYSFTIVPPGWT